MIKAVIFDLDDTLYEEMQFVQGGFKAVAHYVSERYDVDEKAFFQTLLRIHDYSDRGHIFDIALKEVGLFKKALVIKLVQEYRNHEPQLSLYLDAQLALLQLKGLYKLGLITDGNQRVQRSKIRALGLKSFFNVIITTTCYGRDNSKPASLPYQKAISKLNVKPAEAVYVGDNPYKDFIGARKIGMLTIRVLRGPYKNVRLSKTFEADNIVNDLRDIAIFL